VPGVPHGDVAGTGKRYKHAIGMAYNTHTLTTHTESMGNTVITGKLHPQHSHDNTELHTYDTHREHGLLW